MSTSCVFVGLMRFYSKISVMFKICQWSSMLLLIIFSSCSNTDRLILIGNINHKVEGEFHLEINGKFIEGYFKNLQTKDKISIIGNKNKGLLRLEEYAENEKLTGIFIGQLNQGVYRGNWHSPDNSSIVPFEFRGKEKSRIKRKDNRPVNAQTDSIKMVELFHPFYDSWRSKVIKSGDFCSLKECTKVYENLEFYLEHDHFDYCNTSLPDSTAGFVYGDLNSDSYIDAASNVNIVSCIGGNARRFESVVLLFVSNKKGKYKVIDVTEFKSESASGIRAIENGQVEFRHFEFTDNDAYCCPSIEKIQKFEFRNNTLRISN